MTTAATFTRHNPVTGAAATAAAAATAQDACAAVDAAAAAFPAWSALGPNARRAKLAKAADALDAKADAFIDAMMNEVGATEGWARFNLMLASSMVREAAAITTQISGEVIPSDKPGCIAMALREPAGVVLGIAPWNAPIILGVRAIAVPLACGNTVVLKASEQCPRTHALIVEAFVEAGFGDGIVNLVTNAPEDAGDVVGAMIDHPAVRRINFTGSTAVGRIIARRAA
ncbi:MAG: aldehyde dehydrogenase family protein, partial [Blastomonas fulva]|uniref:aldehyde dehydrogenase family protein n=1 Tax=Blastomonas fulva TaxID=1550728 RepID=UPI004034DC33